METNSLGMVIGVLRNLIVLSVLAVMFSCSSEREEDEVIVCDFPDLDSGDDIQNGDIIFQTSLSSQSQAIQLATHSQYSHVGIVFDGETEFYVYEAGQTVKLTTLQKWIDQGENGNYVIKRLKNSGLLTEDVLQRMKEVGEKYIGKNYDLYFGWSDEKMYCSELVWKIYKEAVGVELGNLEKLSDFDLSNSVVQHKLRERYGDSIPMDELVISPVAIFESAQLIEIEHEE